MTKSCFPESTTPRVSDNGILGVTTCGECGKQFTPANKIQRFCSSPCRQSAYRKSPAHDANRIGLRNQRLNRRNSWVRRRRAYKSLSFDGRDSGSLVASVPPLGMINLKQFSKVSGDLTVRNPTEKATAKRVQIALQDAFANEDHTPMVKEWSTFSE